MAASINLPEIVRDIQASRYVSLAGLVLMLYDHVLTFDEEVRLIWSARWTLPKVLFLLIRYLVPVGLIINISEMSGLGNDWVTTPFCKVWFAVAISVGVVTIAIGNFMVLLHIWNLWDRNRRFMLFTMLLFFCTQVTTIVCIAVALTEVIPNTSFSPLLKLCVLDQRSRIGMLWAPGVVFELVAFISLCWNAMERPRDKKTEFTKVLYRDGSIYFLLLFTLRLANLLLAFLAPLSLIFLGVFFIWSTTTLTVTRLILRLRRLSQEREETRHRDPYLEQWGSNR